MNRARHICFFFLFLLIPAGALTQQYFQLLEKPLKSYSKKIARFPNGDVLVGDSPLEPLTPGKNISVFLLRLDPCGDTVWTKKYELGKYYLELNDIKITGPGDIYLYGSAYANSQELIFLTKLTGDGEVLRFRLFNPIYVDHFTFSIDLKNDVLLAYGLLLHWGVPKRGFVVILNRDLNFQWGKSFTPFESEGKAIITRDDGFLCRSGPYLYKLNKLGALQWATTLQTEPGVYALAGPVETDNGYVMEASGPGFGFFYKVDLFGNFVWKSAKFSAAKGVPDLEMRPDGNIIAAWNYPGAAGESIPAVLILSPGGEILRGQKLMPDGPIDIGPLSLSVDEDNTINLVGSANPYITKPDKVTDFIGQFSLDSLSGNCFRWEPIPAPTPNAVPLKFVPIDTLTVDATMNDVTAGSFLFQSLEPELRSLCGFTNSDQVIAIDTVLPCDQPWQVALPSPDFRWDDGSPDNPRLLYRAGFYQASSRPADCSQPITYRYQLQKQVCNCSIYLPNAFSPNDDGRNDRIGFSSNCTPVRWQMLVYDRWGNRVFESQDSNRSWDGTIRQKPALPGVYLVVINYEMMDNSGVIQKGDFVQDVALFR